MRKRIFCFTLFWLIQLLISLAAAPTVNIPDDYALETDLNKAAGDAITATDAEAGVSDVIVGEAGSCCECKGCALGSVDCNECFWCD